MPRRSAALIGRDEQLDVLLTAVDEAAAGRPRTVVVCGEAGMGKSRLVREAVARSGDRALVAAGHGVRMAAGALPLGTAGELLRALVRAAGDEAVREILGDQVAALAPVVPRLGRAHRGPGVDVLALVAATQDLVAALGEERLVVMVLEDLHWADVVSLDVVSALVRTFSAGRLLVLATVRALEAEPDAAEAWRQVSDLSRLPQVAVVELTALSETEVAEQVRQLDSAVTAGQVHEILRLSQGNPLYVEELVATDARLSSTLRIDLAGRLQGLSPQTLRVLETAALESRPVDNESVAWVCQLDLDSVAAAVDEAVGRGLVVTLSRGRWQFHHELLREAAAASAAPSTRAVGHRRWADRFERADHPSAFDLIAAADHREAVGPLDVAFAARLRAARLCHRVVLGEDVANQWLSALALLHQGEAVTDEQTWEEVLVCAYTSNVLRSAVIDDLVAADVAACPAAPPVRQMWRVVAGFTAAQPGAAVPRPDELSAMLARLEGETPRPMVFHACAMLRGALMESGRTEELVRATELARSLLPAVDEVLPEGRIMMLNAREALPGGRSGNQLEATLADGEELMDRWVRHSGDRAWVQSVLSSVHLLNGQVELARELVERAVVQAGALERTPWQVARTMQITVWWWSGRWDDLVDVAPRIGNDSDFAGLAEFPRALASLVRLHRGETDGPPPTGEGTVARLVRATAASTGPSADVLALLGGMWPSYTDGEEEFCGELVLGAAHVAAKSPTDEAVSVVREMIAGLEDGAPLWQPAAATARAVLDDTAGVDTRAAWAGLVSTWEQLGVPWHAARSRFRLGELLCEDGDREQAALVLGPALEVAERLGARPLADAVRSLAARARLRLPGHEPSTAPSDGGLTARELEVLALLVTGQTNEQIGSTLFMSPRTASVHVSRILAKLHAANRTEVAAIAHRRGLV